MGDTRALVYHCLLTAFLVGVADVGWAAGERVDVTAKKRSDRKHQGERQDLPRGSTRVEEAFVYYEFTVRGRVPNLPDPLRVEWVVVLERPGGRLVEATRGHENISLGFGKSVVVESESIKLTAREWEHRKGGGTIEDKLRGYMVRVLDAEGTALAEKYSPASLESDIAWLKQEKNGQDARGEKFLEKIQRKFERKEKRRRDQ